MQLTTAEMGGEGAERRRMKRSGEGKMIDGSVQNAVSLPVVFDWIRVHAVRRNFNVNKTIRLFCLPSPPLSLVHAALQISMRSFINA